MNWKKFLLIGLAVGALCIRRGAAERRRGVSVGIGFGFPFGFGYYGYGYPYGYVIRTATTTDIRATVVYVGPRTGIITGIMAGAFTIGTPPLSSLPALLSRRAEFRIELAGESRPAHFLRRIRAGRSSSNELLSSDARRSSRSAITP